MIHTVITKGGYVRGRLLCLSVAIRRGKRVEVYPRTHRQGRVDRNLGRERGASQSVRKSQRHGDEPPKNDWCAEMGRPWEGWP